MFAGVLASEVVHRTLMGSRRLRAIVRLSLMFAMIRGSTCFHCGVVVGVVGMTGTRYLGAREADCCRKAIAIVTMNKIGSRE